MRKSTMSITIFDSFLYVYQMGKPPLSYGFPLVFLGFHWFSYGFPVVYQRVNQPHWRTCWVAMWSTWIGSGTCVNFPTSSRSNETWTGGDGDHGIRSHIVIVTGWWLSPTPLKNHGVCQLGWLFPIYGKIKHIPNHQPPTKIVRWPDNKNPIPFKNKTSQENVFQPTNRWIWPTNMTWRFNKQKWGLNQVQPTNIGFEQTSTLFNKH